MITQDLVDYYSNLLIVEYNNKPNAVGQVGLFAEEGIADQIVQSTMDAYDLDTAVGVQLDVLAKWVGASRQIYGFTTGVNFFTMPFYGDTIEGSYIGFGLYADVSESNNFAVYTDTTGSKYNLNDYDLRQYIKLIIQVNNCTTGLAKIDNIIYDMFEDHCLLTDGLDMTITYTFDSTTTGTLALIAAFTNILPRPAGVSLTIIQE